MSKEDDDVDVDVDDDVLKEKLKKKIEETAIELSNIAGVPMEHRERFYGMMEIVLHGAYRWHLDLQMPRIYQERGWGTEKKFKDLEKAVWALHNALRALTKEQYDFFYRMGMGYFHHGKEFEELPNWLAEVENMFITCSVITGKNPNRGTRRHPGNKKGNIKNPLLDRLTRELWMCAHSCGGDLTANCKNNVGSGTMFKALDRLQHYFPNGFVKPSAGTIVDIVKSLRDSRGT